MRNKKLPSLIFAGLLMTPFVSDGAMRRGEAEESAYRKHREHAIRESQESHRPSVTYFSGNESKLSVKSTIFMSDNPVVYVCEPSLDTCQQGRKLYETICAEYTHITCFGAKYSDSEEELQGYFDVDESQQPILMLGLTAPFNESYRIFNADSEEQIRSGIDYLLE